MSLRTRRVVHSQSDEVTDEMSCVCVCVFITRSYAQLKCVMSFQCEEQFARASNCWSAVKSDSVTHGR